MVSSMLGWWWRVRCVCVGLVVVGEVCQCVGLVVVGEVC